MGKHFKRVIDKAINTADDMKNLKMDYSKLKNIASQVNNMDISNSSKQKIINAVYSGMKELEGLIDEEYKKMGV